MKNVICILGGLLLGAAFGVVSAQDKIGRQEFLLLSRYMIGSFSSEEQSRSDSNFLSISLKMTPIMETDRSLLLYVEQAVSKTPDKPYRQRLYQLRKISDTIVLSTVLEFRDPAPFVGAWKEPKLQDEILKMFNRFTGFPPDSSLFERKGCAIHLRRKGNEFLGSTEGKGCASSLRGASYATSEAVINAEGLVTLDRGWNAEGKQVWGSTYGGYRFRRLTPIEKSSE